MTHCRKEGRADHCLLGGPITLWIRRESRVPLQQETDGSAHACLCLCRFGSLKWWLHAAQHLGSTGNVWPWHALHTHSILKDQPGYTRKARAKYCSQDSMAVQKNTIRRIHSNPPTQSETKSSLWRWNHTALRVHETLRTHICRFDYTVLLGKLEYRCKILLSQAWHFCI